MLRYWMNGYKFFSRLGWHMYAFSMIPVKVVKRAETRRDLTRKIMALNSEDYDIGGFSLLTTPTELSDFVEKRHSEQVYKTHKFC